MSTAWTARTERNPSLFTAPLVTTDRVYVSLDAAVWALDRATGAPLWEASVDGRAGRILLSREGGLVASTSPRGATHLVGLDETGQTSWTHRVTPGLLKDTVAVSGGRIFALRDTLPTSTLLVLDASSGAIVERTQTFAGRATFQQVGDDLYVVDRDALYREDGRAFVRVREPGGAQLAVVGDRWITLRRTSVGTGSVEVRADDGELLWSRPTGGWPFDARADAVLHTKPPAPGAGHFDPLEIELLDLATGAPRWTRTLECQRGPTFAGAWVRAALDDRQVLLDADTGLEAFSVPGDFTALTVVDGVLYGTAHEQVVARPLDATARPRLDASDLRAAIEARLASDSIGDVPDLAELELWRLTSEERLPLLRLALEQETRHGGEVGNALLERATDATDESLADAIHAAIAIASPRYVYLLDDLAERLRALPAGEAQTRSWLRLVDKLVPYSATAPALVAEAPDAVFEDASSWPRLLDAAFENRCLGVFFERTERGVARGSLARDTVTMAGERLREIEGWLPLGSGLRLAGARLREGVGLPPPKAAEPRPRSELAVAPRSAEEESLRHRGEQLTLLRTVSDRAGFGPPWALTSSWARALLPLTRGNATWMTPQSAHHRGHAGWLHGMEAFFEGAVAAADAARAAGFDGAASPDPFGLQKGKRPLTTPALDRFTKAASDLGEVLEGALRSAADAPDLLARADARVARLAGSLGDTDPMAVRRGVLDAMALGVAYGFATHRIRGGPFDPVFAALIERGGLAKPKKPSLAALTRAHPPLGFWPVTARPTRPASATQSCVARGPDEVPCPSVDDDARPTELGATTSFVCQVALHGLRGLPDGFAHGAALLAVFRGTRYHVVALGAADVAARERRPFEAAGLETLAVGRKGKEPVDPEWARRRSPELFPGPQSLSDVETVLGCYAAKTEDKRHAGSKIGGTYTPVQPKATGLVAGGAHLVFQLSFDDGAPLPDAGLLYVFALEGGGFAATDEHL